ncbi:hypothetical protein J4419_05575 [Candidatus Woesearchaeota archaeon]|nr:hypothetical protein [Candidatus Woesearchaeota archaeon]
MSLLSLLGWKTQATPEPAIEPVDFSHGEPHTLEATGLEVRVHPKIKYVDRGVVDTLSSDRTAGVEKWGFSFTNYREADGIFENIVERIRGLGTYEEIFVHGHEEAHTLVALGQATALRAALLAAGEDTRMLPQKLAENSDRAMWSWYDAAEKGNPLPWFSPTMIPRMNDNWQEKIAHYGGLLALRRAQAPEPYVQDVRNAIESIVPSAFPKFMDKYLIPAKAK